MPQATREDRGTRALRAANRDHLTDLLRAEGPMSRTELAERLGLTRSAVTAIVASLIDDGLLCEVAPPAPDAGADRPASRGRPRILVGLDPSAARVVAIQVGARWARVVLADAAGGVLATDSVHVLGAAPADVVARVVEVAERLAAADAGRPVAGIGVCVPGAVDTATGRVLRSDVLGWEDVPLAELLAARLPVPVFVQDVTQAATLAEARVGVAADSRNAIVVDYGTRIGIGLILDGRLHRGASGLAGSFGHTAVFGATTPCRCGRVGCLEAVASIRAMVPTEVQHRHGPDHETSAFAEVVSRMQAGDPELAAVVDEALERAAHALASLVALIDPEVLVLTGMIVQFPSLAERLLERIGQIVPPENRGRIDLRCSTLGLQAWVRGAILVALQQLQPNIERALAGQDPIAEPTGQR